MFTGTESHASQHSPDCAGAANSKDSGGHNGVVLNYAERGIEHCS